MKQLAVLSGKGGTGKTSLVGAFAALAGKSVLADCDVDAADLHLITDPVVRERGEFSGGSRAEIDPELCTACGRCQEVCRFRAVESGPSEDTAAGVRFRVNPIACEGCGVCSWFCGSSAARLHPVVNGTWFRSDTRWGPMVHARLGIAEECSGKLVSLIREKAREAASELGIPLVLIDGSPGTGCPVIASMTGVDLVLLVSEPTLSGMHDLARVSDLAGHFGTRAVVCINRWDINPDITGEIERECRERSLPLAGRIRFDRAVVEAQVAGITVVEYGSTGAAEDIRQVWERTTGYLGFGGRSAGEAG
jgi:MinD superfamily P-loop ATPase